MVFENSVLVFENSVLVFENSVLVFEKGVLAFDFKLCYSISNHMSDLKKLFVICKLTSFLAMTKSEM
jgi:hypothetical protein